MNFRIQLPFCLIVTLLLTVISVSGCGQESAGTGTYIAETSDPAHHHETTLELKESGAGIWRVGDDEVNFSWHLKGNELRLLTKNGGVITGSMDKEVIHVTLPGSKELFFKKLK